MQASVVVVALIGMMMSLTIEARSSSRTSDDLRADLEQLFAERRMGPVDEDFDDTLMKRANPSPRCKEMKYGPNNYWGDIPGMPEIRVQSPFQCGLFCEYTPKCIAWTMNSNGACMLKNATSSTVNSGSTYTGKCDKA